MLYIAHTENGRVQPLIDHLKGTAELAKEFADQFGAGELAEKVALYHDIGKYSKTFQKRVLGANIHVDHSSAGAQLLYSKNNNTLGLLAAYCIAGHHSGLLDGGRKSQPQVGELYGRLSKELEDYSAYSNDFSGDNGKLPIPGLLPKNGFQAAFFARMIFSALVDADWLDTERFVHASNKLRGGSAGIAELWRMFEKKLSMFSRPSGVINEMRSEILKNCLDMSSQGGELFTLTAPTGSGKTISSMAFALKHAVLRGRRRIIYVVPYNTIIEQNAGVFEKMLGLENVLQHHNGITYSSDEQDPEYRKRLATENWDAPVVVTSNVRFFESLYSNSPSECRKLHNISNSVLVFDEAQMIPLPYLIPCVEAIKELVLNYNCTTVLATATQSGLDEFFKPLKLKEIVSAPSIMHELFRRVDFDNSIGKLSDDELATLLCRHRKVLCIVNTRLRAQQLAKKIQGAIHLSTTMYPNHRSKKLKEIRKLLDKEGAPCIVISTSLIEAGVDIDFPTVYREKAGLDNIIQSAGRCNRESKRKREDSIVFIFESEDKPHNSIAQNISAYEHAARSTDDIFSLEAVRLYFEKLRDFIGEEGLDRKSVVKAFIDGGKNAFSLPFEFVAKSFHLIEEDTKTVYVLDEAPELENRLRNGERTRELFRELQKYGVSLYKSDFIKLEYQFERIDEEIYLLPGQLYSETFGIALVPEGGVGLNA